MTAIFAHALHGHLGIAGELKIFEPYQYVADADDVVRRRFDIDTVNLTPEPVEWIARRHPRGFDVLLPRLWREITGSDGATEVVSSTGTVIARRPAGGYYFDPVNPPLRDLSSAADVARFRETIQAFDWPAFADESDDALAARAAALHKTGGCVVFNLCCHLLAAGQLLRGYEQFMVDLVADEALARALLDSLIEGYLRRGAVREFIPDLIELGVTALNPVQVSAAGMDLAGLKRAFGGDIAFWGGGVDTQAVLNKRTPAEVADAVKRTLDIMAPNGGYVFCQVHNIQPDVPPENVVAMFEALG
ncbi:MAG: uroporphyrinogen decarboxylase family protein [Kiritimatiellae bacterium]|nr:uroporphyrinogen decarboxylase family protein [Kiritimatiellia bacterium]